MLKPSWMRAGLQGPDTAPRTLSVHIGSAAVHGRHGRFSRGWDLLVKVCFLCVDCCVVHTMRLSSPASSHNQVSVLGHPSDTAVFRTRVHPNTTVAHLNESFSSPIHDPASALLLLQLKDKDPRSSDVLGYAGLCVAELHEGAWTLALRDPLTGNVVSGADGAPQAWVEVTLAWGR